MTLKQMIKSSINFLCLFLPLVIISPAWGIDARQKLQELEQKLLELEKRIQSRQSASPSPPLPTEIQTPVLPDPSNQENQSEVIDESSPISKKNMEEDGYGFTISEEDDLIEPDNNPYNRIGFHFGFTIPNDTEMGMGKISFDPGIVLGVEYFRYFIDHSYLGIGFDIKVFQADGALTVPYNNSSLEFKYSGDCSISDFYFTLGQEWELSESLSILTQASIGFAFSKYELNFAHHPTNSTTSTEKTYDISDSSFYYSFLAGLNYYWNEKWQSALYYELDGRSEAGELDYQSFHQIGVKTSFAF